MSEERFKSDIERLNHNLSDYWPCPMHDLWSCMLPLHFRNVFAMPYTSASLHRKGAGISRVAVNQEVRAQGALGACRVLLLVWVELLLMSSDELAVYNV